MTNEEIERVVSERASLLKDKADADREWHTEVRKTLKDHGLTLIEIKSAIAAAATVALIVTNLEARVVAIEKFNIRASAYMMGGLAVVATGWKVVDHLWK